MLYVKYKKKIRKDMKISKKKKKNVKEITTNTDRKKVIKDDFEGRTYTSAFVTSKKCTPNALPTELFQSLEQYSFNNYNMS